MGRHDEASQAFLHAYQLDQKNYNAQYRAFRSLALADDEEGFKKFLSVEIIAFPEIAELLIEDETFTKMLLKDDIIELIKNASDT